MHNSSLLLHNSSLLTPVVLLLIHSSWLSGHPDITSLIVPSSGYKETLDKNKIMYSNVIKSLSLVPIQVVTMVPLGSLVVTQEVLVGLLDHPNEHKIFSLG